MLKRLKAKNFKSLADLEVRMKSLMLILGPNASGKSNFLDALHLISGVVTGRTLRDAFEFPYRGRPLESFTFGPQGITDLLSRKKLKMEFEIDVELSAKTIREVEQQVRTIRTSSGKLEWEKRNSSPVIKEKNLRYHIDIEMIPKTGLMYVTDEWMIPLNEKGNPRRKADPLLKADGYLSFKAEGETFFLASQQETNRSVLSLPLYPPAHPHLTAFKKELENWFFFYFEPRERMRSPNPVREVTNIGPMGEDLASYLNTLRVLNPIAFKNLEEELRRVIPSVTGIETTLSSWGEVELLIREGEALIPSRVVSEGTLRVLGLLALGTTQSPPSLICFEEPENGIHPKRIKLVAEYLKEQAAKGESQLILTTHSPALVSLIPETYLYSCIKQTRQTQIRPYSTLNIKSKKEITQYLDAENGPPG